MPQQHHRNHCLTPEEILRARREPVSVALHSDTLSIRIGVERVAITADQAVDLANRLVEVAEIARRREEERRLEQARATRELRVLTGGAA